MVFWHGFTSYLKTFSINHLRVSKNRMINFYQNFLLTKGHALLRMIKVKSIDDIVRIMLKLLR